MSSKPKLVYRERNLLNWEWQVLIPYCCGISGVAARGLTPTEAWNNYLESRDVK